MSFRQNPAINWQTENPVLAQGEIGLDTTTGVFKIGDGRTAWNSIFDCYVKNGIGLLASKTVQTNIGTKQNLYTVPAGKELYVSAVNVGKASASLQSMSSSMSITGNSTNDFGSLDLTELKNPTRFINQPYDSVSFGFVPILVAGATLGAVFNDTAINATVRIDVFGYLIDA